MKRKADTAMQEASTSISVTKREYREKKAELQSKINAVAKREQDAQNMIDNESALIERLAEEKIAEEKRIVQQKCDVTLNKYKQYFNKRMKQLKQDYDIKFDSLNVFAVGGPLICVLMTVLTAIHSKRFSSDFAGFFKAIGSSLMDMCRDFEKGSLGGKVFALIAIIICIGIVCVITYGAVEIIKHYMADGISIFVALVSMIVIVWFADDMSSVSMNLIGLYLLINVGYIVARMIYIAIRNDF